MGHLYGLRFAKVMPETAGRICYLEYTVTLSFYYHLPTNGFIDAEILSIML
jgi:hypothetical protein